MKVRRLLAITIASSISVTAFAGANSEALIKKYGCNGCHSIDKSAVGPAFKEIAAKYRGNKHAMAMLAKKVRNGGSGVWGRMPMPPTSPESVSDADIKTIIHWVLSLK